MHFAPNSLGNFPLQLCISGQRTKLICSLVTFQVFPAYLFMLKICRVGLCTELFSYLVSPGIFFCSAIPISHYILKVFQYCLCHFFCWYQVHLMLKFAINHKAAKICLHRLPHALQASVHDCFIAKWFVSMHTIDEIGIANQ